MNLIKINIFAVEKDTITITNFSDLKNVSITYSDNIINATLDQSTGIISVQSKAQGKGSITISATNGIDKVINVSVNEALHFTGDWGTNGSTIITFNGIGSNTYNVDKKDYINPKIVATSYIKATYDASASTLVVSTNTRSNNQVAVFADGDNVKNENLIKVNTYVGKPIFNPTINTPLNIEIGQTLEFALTNPENFSPDFDVYLSFSNENLSLKFENNVLTITGLAEGQQKIMWKDTYSGNGSSNDYRVCDVNIVNAINTDKTNLDLYL